MRERQRRKRQTPAGGTTGMPDTDHEAGSSPQSPSGGTPLQLAPGDTPSLAARDSAYTQGFRFDRVATLPDHGTAGQLEPGAGSPPEPGRDDVDLFAVRASRETPTSEQESAVDGEPVVQRTRELRFGASRAVPVIQRQVVELASDHGTVFYSSYEKELADEHYSDWEKPEFFDRREDAEKRDVEMYQLYRQVHAERMGPTPEAPMQPPTSSVVKQDKVEETKNPGLNVRFGASKTVSSGEHHQDYTFEYSNAPQARVKFNLDDWSRKKRNPGKPPSAQEQLPPGWAEILPRVEQAVSAWNCKESIIPRIWQVLGGAQLTMPPTRTGDLDIAIPDVLASPQPTLQKFVKVLIASQDAIQRREVDIAKIPIHLRVSKKGGKKTADKKGKSEDIREVKPWTEVLEEARGDLKQFLLTTQHPDPAQSDTKARDLVNSRLSAGKNATLLEANVLTRGTGGIKENTGLYRIEMVKSGGGGYVAVDEKEGTFNFSFNHLKAVIQFEFLIVADLRLGKV